MISLSTAAVRALSEGLVQTKCLKKLYVFNKEGEMVDVLTSAFTGDIRNTSVEYLHLPGNLERLGIALPVLLSSNNQNLKEISLDLDWEEVTQGVVDEFRMVAESFRTRESSVVDASRKVFLQSICDTTAKFTEDVGRRAFSCLDSWADASERAPMLKTNLRLNFTGSGVGERWNMKPGGDVKGWFLRAVNRYIHLNGLQVMLGWMWDAVVDMDNFLLLCEGIQSNDSVESLCIWYTGSEATVDRKCWTHLFHCLRHKRRLKELIFYDEYTGNETFRSLMDLLQVNIYLEDVVLAEMDKWESEGKCAMVKEPLKRNRAQASYFSTLRDAWLPFENARAGRIFLCGNPHAGKTMLRATMMETRQKTSWVKRKLNKPFGLKQTKGVDVELLRDDEEMQVSIWDLAGQEIFRALHTLLLPTVTQACVFAFIFNPMKDDQHQQLEMKEHLEEAFGKELESWLRFIASNYPITGTFLPEVLIVVTHRDRMRMHNMEESCDWAERIAKGYRIIYKKALNLHEEIFYVDAQDVKEVKPFAERVLQLFSDMLQKMSPRAPSVCSKLISEILNRPSEVTGQPVESIKGDRFFIPTIFQRGEIRNANLSWETAESSDWQHLGYRLLCESRDTSSLTSAVFPRFQKLTARVYRGDQVILEKELIERLREAVEEKLLQEEITWPTGEEGGESLINYEHIWPSAPEANLPKCCQRAVELLEEKDVSEILKPLREKEEATLQRLCKVSEQLDDFKDAGKEGLELSRQKGDEGWRNLNDEGKAMVRILLDHSQKGFEEVHRGIEGVHDHLQEIHRDLSQQLRTISDLQKKACSTLLSVMSKIDMMVGYSEAREAARLPRRPFITSNDVGLREKIRGVVQIGTAVRLHFMCESRLEQHIVEDQPGMKLIVGDKNKVLLRSILVNSTRVFWFLLKAGVQVTLGAGSVIPELADLSQGSKAGLVFADMTLDKLKNLDSLPVMEKSQMAEEVWMFLRDQLSPEKKNSSSFNLYLVKYNPGTVPVEESHAWLCKKCIDKGQKNKLLKLL
ncbi:hypothetical protein R1flu_028902 [Riccia fluitans]|uniref:C-terminal of Roc (COR) domain-containing protein n=1 Tax=Riccia fluitans TaxID=41844 RepID=A0ABD1XN04_9MARC